MTSIRCTVCSAITDAMLCKTCTGTLEQALAELPADLTDLQAVATGQASGPMGLGDPLRQWDGRPTADALDVTPWMFAPGASDLLWAARNTTLTWARHLAESRGLPFELARVRVHQQIGPVCAGHAHDAPDPGCASAGGVCKHLHPEHVHRPPRPGCPPDCRKLHCRHASCTAIRQPEQHDEWNVLGWLLANIDAIRQDEAAAEIHDEITSLHAAMDAAILGRSGLEEFYGCCDRPDVRVQHLTFAGPRCFGLTGCTHDSCALVRGEHEMYTPTVSTCGAQLNGREDAAEVTCPACGEVYATADRKSGMLAKLPDKLGTIREVAGALSSLDRPVHVEALLSAVRRNRIPVRGYGPGNERLVRVGDVEEYLEKQAERSAMRRSA